jgi:starch synthase
VTNLVEALGQIPALQTQVHCFGASRPDAFSYQIHDPFTVINPATQSLLIDLDIAQALSGVQLAHSHTWYANFAGHLASKMYDIPHVITAHSLEPLRPWKSEQLGGGYEISSWVERISYQDAAAIIAVSDGMRSDVLQAYPNVAPDRVVTIRNGIDVTRFQPRHDPAVLEKYSIRGPFALFVGRITRQKGLAHLLRAWKEVPSEYGLVLAASSPDEPAIGAEVESLINELQGERNNVIWLREMLNRDELVALLTSARVFACPSIYEPLGIVNLEAMACQTAVVASAVGGIPEVVLPGQTGELVALEEDRTIFESDFARALIKVMSDESLAARYGIAGRNRATQDFSWDKVAEQTYNLYRSLR